MYKRISRWLKIHYTLKEGNPYFIFKGQRYHLGNVKTNCPIILRTQNNPWGGISDCPDHIHGYSSDSYNPIYVELHNSGECVRVYEYEKE